MRSILSAVVMCVASTSFAATWEFDPAHSQATFSVKHMMVATVKGQFKTLSGKIDLDDKDITKSKAEVKIDAASIDTNQAKRDEHLKSAEFFDVAKCPQLTFVSKKVEKAGEGKLKLIGDLNMHCVTKEVTFDVTGPSGVLKGPFGNTMRYASASTVLNRKDFGLTWNKSLEAGGVLVGDEVTVNLELELVPPAAGTKAAKAESKAVEKKQ